MINKTRASRTAPRPACLNPSRCGTLSLPRFGTQFSSHSALGIADHPGCVQLYSTLYFTRVPMNVPSTAHATNELELAEPQSTTDPPLLPAHPTIRK